MLRIPFSTIATLAYGAIYFLLTSLMEAEYVSQSYPILYVGFSMIAQLLVVAGVVLFALDAPADYARLWRWIFPLLVCDFVLGLYGFGASPSAFGSWRPPTILISRWPAMGRRVRHANRRPVQATSSHLTSTAEPMHARQRIISSGGTAPSAAPARARPRPRAHLLPVCCALTATRIPTAGNQRARELSRDCSRELLLLPTRKNRIHKQCHPRSSSRYPKQRDSSSS